MFLIRLLAKQHVAVICFGLTFGIYIRNVIETRLDMNIYSDKIGLRA